MISLYVVNETSPLKAVVVGTARSSSPMPKPEEAYDPKSLQHILAGTYPLEAHMIPEMDGLAQILQKYGVTVYRPELLEDYIQIFARDIAFVIEDKLFHAHTVSNRAREYDALTEIIAQIAPKQDYRASQSDTDRRRRCDSVERLYFYRDVCLARATRLPTPVAIWNTKRTPNQMGTT